MSFGLTRKTDYALVALARLAEEPAGEPLSARQIAEQFNLPTSLLMNVLKDLHRAEIIRSRRGAGGGYSLSHEPEQISLLRIIEAIEGPVQVALCCDDHEAHADEDDDEACVACSVMEKCPIVTPMQRFDELLQTFLQRVTLRDLITNEMTVSLTHLGARA